MNTTKVRRASFTIAGIELEGFLLPGGEYAMSQTQIASAIGKHHFQVARFLEEKWVEVLPSEGFKSHNALIEKDNTGRGGRGHVKLVPPLPAYAFWHSQSIKGNKKAAALTLACGLETLERRIDKAFNVYRTEEDRENATRLIAKGEWHKSRDFVETCHGAFQSACIALKLNAAQVHDMLTVAITGCKASEHRELPCVDGEPSVGLNHLSEDKILTRIGYAKLFFSKTRTGTVEERINKAVREVYKRGH